MLNLELVDNDLTDAVVKKKYKSPLRYPGGKQKAINNIAPYLPRYFSEYREPFVGGGSLYFYVYSQYPELRKYWINDLNSDLVYFWSASAHNLSDLVDGVRLLKRKYVGKGKTLYNNLLKAKQTTPLDTAIKFFVLNRITFSGTIESGGYSDLSYQTRFTESSIVRLSELNGCFRNTMITRRDYRDVILTPGEDVFIYLDPPYLSNAKSKLYGKKGDLHKNFDHERFASELKYCPHQWLLTYDDCDEVRSLFSDYNIRLWELQYGMNNYKQKKASKGKELIITNY